MIQLTPLLLHVGYTAVLTTIVLVYRYTSARCVINHNRPTERAAQQLGAHQQTERRTSVQDFILHSIPIVCNDWIVDKLVSVCMLRHFHLAL
jgi:hypothetical protein